MTEEAQPSDQHILTPEELFIIAERKRIMPLLEVKIEELESLTEELVKAYKTAYPQEASIQALTNPPYNSLEEANAVRAQFHTIYVRLMKIISAL